MPKRIKTWVSDLKSELRADNALFEAFKVREKSPFIKNVFMKRRFWELSAKQIDAVKRAGAGIVKFEKMKADEAEKLKTAPVIKEGRYALGGKVISIKERSTRFGYALKMLVASPSGNKVWGTVPKSILSSVEKGNVVKFTATIKRADGEKHFAFFSRPTDAEIVKGS